MRKRQNGECNFFAILDTFSSEWVLMNLHSKSSFFKVRWGFEFWIVVSIPTQILCTVSLSGEGTQLWVTRHVPPKRRCFFSLALTERPPFLPTFTQWPPIFRKFRHFWRNVEKFLAILTLKAPIFWCISLKDPLFLWALSLKDGRVPFFDIICHRKTPTSEVLGGTRTSLSYVSAPPDHYPLVTVQGDSRHIGFYDKLEYFLEYKKKILTLFLTRIFVRMDSCQIFWPCLKGQQFCECLLCSLWFYDLIFFCKKLYHFHMNKSSTIFLKPGGGVILFMHLDILLALSLVNNELSLNHFFFSLQISWTHYQMYACIFHTGMFNGTCTIGVFSVSMTKEVNLQYFVLWFEK